MNETEVMDVLKLILIDETKKNFKLREAFKEETGIDFDEKTVMNELENMYGSDNESKGICQRET